MMYSRDMMYKNVYIFEWVLDRGCLERNMDDGGAHPQTSTATATLPVPPWREATRRTPVPAYEAQTRNPDIIFSYM